MDLSGYLDKSATMSVFGTFRSGNVVNCYDQAAALTCLGRLLGTNSEYCFLQPFGYLNPINLVGFGICNNPFFAADPSKQLVDKDAPRSSFRNHAFVRLNGKIYDSCGGPEMGTNSLSNYLTLVIDRSKPFETNKAASVSAMPDVCNFTILK